MIWSECWPKLSRKLLAKRDVHVSQRGNKVFESLGGFHDIRQNHDRWVSGHHGVVQGGGAS